jgi:hypothetical protein
VRSLPPRGQGEARPEKLTKSGPTHDVSGLASYLLLPLRWDYQHMMTDSEVGLLIAVLIVYDSHRWALSPISGMSDIGLSLILELPISDLKELSHEIEMDRVWNWWIEHYFEMNLL